MSKLIIILCLAVVASAASLHVPPDLSLKSEKFVAYEDVTSMANITDATFTVPLDHNRPQDGRTANFVNKNLPTSFPNLNWLFRPITQIWIITK